MSKRIVYAEEARNNLKAGVDKLAKAVVTTLGPKGRNVALAKSWGSPNVTHDGVTVAEDIELSDPLEDMGARLTREAASKTNDVAGDGTTTAVLLTKAITEEGLKNITAGANPMVLRRSIEQVASKVVEELQNTAKSVSTKEEKAQVATISAGDEEIGEKIADALERVGDNGVVTVEEGRGLEIEVDYTEGMQFDKGYASPYFITDSERMEAVIEEPRILITDKEISSLNEFLPALENLVKQTKNVVIIADGFEGEALATLVVNKLRGTFNVLAVEAPGFGDRKKANLSDIATLTGGTFISEETGRDLESVTVEDLGRAERVVSTKEETTIVGGKGSKEDIEAQVAQLKKQIEQATSDYDREKLEERVARLAGGVAVIRVGAATETQLKERKYRVEDAVNATRAALEEGIVPGGGVALIRAREVLEEAAKTGGEENLGAKIVYNALEAPLRKIVENAGEDSGWILREVEKEEDDFGYDVVAMEFGHMFEKGIIDPAKVARSALQNAASVATMVLTTEALVCEEPEDSEGNNAAGGSGRMGGMGGMGGGMPGM
ncbi:MAG: chaperonin GroEL [Patescibacteria group bacterium]|nr:chaperonin GroEL [Patescibacteria group bacterium]